MTGSYLLSHTLNNCPSDSYFSYVKPYSGKPVPKGKLLSPEFVGINFVDETHETVFVDNPILTDETQAVHTDIHQILKQNPDINGLSLILDDQAAQSAAASIQLEDFMKPARYYDVFDIYDFVKQAERSFQMLPASLRKQFNNSSAELCQAISGKDPRALAAISEFLGLASDTKSASQAATSTLEPSKDVSDSAAPSENSEDSK